jgi:D-alanyl-D-alanine dipeptidase
MRKWMVFFFICCALNSFGQNGREGFVSLSDQIPSIVLDIRYYTTDNFVGARIDGYLRPKALLTKEAAMALQNVQRALAKEGLGLKVFDAYRPQKGVNHFIRWAKQPADTLTKQKYYPEVDKKDVFKLGYVASRSGHSRGSTLDLTIVELETGVELDMGSGWDFFGNISGHGTNQITMEQAANRQKLKSVMEQYGFKAYSKEWWHYTLRNEPYPDTYFDFDVE